MATNQAFERYLKQHREANDGIRLGQRFCNDFIKGPWPKLFYAEQEYDCVGIILGWLESHHYFNEMPPKVIRE